MSKNTQQLEWTGRGGFSDHARGFRAVGAGVYDVPADAVEEYLNHRSGNWQRPDDSDDATTTDDNNDSGSQTDDTSSDDAEPADADAESEDAEETGDDQSASDDLAIPDASERGKLVTIASNYDFGEDINGNSGSEEIVAALEDLDDDERADALSSLDSADE